MRITTAWAYACAGAGCAAVLVTGFRAAAAEPPPSAPSGVKQTVKPPAARDAAPAGPALIDRKHHLGPGDTVEIRVDGQEEYSRSVRLFADGTFDYPRLGVVQASGLTVADLQAVILDGLKKEFRRPVVTVALREVYVPPKPDVKNPRVTVLGAANHQGHLDLPEPVMLRVLMADIGPSARADIAHIRIKFPDGTGRIVDFSDFTLTGASKDDLLITGGEEITFPERPAVQKPDPIRVEVLGMVNHPGPVEAEGGANILQILDRAGGPKLGAELTALEVTGPAHPSKLLVNVEKYMKGDTSAKYSAQPDDVIIVRDLPIHVFTYGEVGHQGEVAVREGTRMLDLYLAVGGGSSTAAVPVAQINVSGGGLGGYGGYGGGGGGGGADIGHAQIIRRGPNGKLVTTTLDFRDIMKQHDKKNELVRNNDVLFIPSKKIKRGLAYYLSALSPVWLLQGLAAGVMP